MNDEELDVAKDRLFTKLRDDMTNTYNMRIHKQRQARTRNIALCTLDNFTDD